MLRYVLTAVLVLGAVSHAEAQVATQQAPASTVTLAGIGMFIYPANDQSPEQQQQDEAACTQWAEAQTGLTLQPGSVDTQAAADAAQQQAANANPGSGGWGSGPWGTRGCRHRRHRG